uniref:acetylcholinesterase-like n=1 Tax=Styela clava TaxID=7725 RepID=UPI001939D1A5|nr:acetylcholinesterase-like [Styela clava]
MKGNQGLKDQQLALKWVTIFGNSAGAQSVMFHTLSGVSKNLFRNSIQQSNPAIFSFVYPSIDESLRITDRLLQNLDCFGSERECLMNSSPETIVNQTAKVEFLTYFEEELFMYIAETYLPVIDEVEFVDQPISLYRDGKWNKHQNMIIGINTQESEYQAGVSQEIVYDEQFFMLATKALFGGDIAPSVVEKYKELYPLKEDEDFRVTFGKLLTDYTLVCPSLLMAKYAANTSDNSSVYFYANNQKVLLDTCVTANDGNKTGCYYSFHASELEYVFRTYEEVRTADFTAEDELVADQFSAFWGSFSRTGNPSNDSMKYNDSFSLWPEFKYSKDWNYLLINTASEVKQKYKESICNFWDETGYVHRKTAEFTTGSMSITSDQQLTTDTGVLIQVNIWQVIISVLISIIGSKF